MVSILKFSAEYVETLSPTERKLYWVYFERDEEEKRKQKEKQNQYNGPIIGSGIDMGI